ncbi:MAG: hypothetical protein HY221_02565 [Candidatus Sungbacteria bacterium]|uniref:HTH HARE-type domain-containing protein n=1 Tax=Candidatus Sungiibacteriota bacterium TaxID=2750080 RepID=A0A932VSH7_9BACT|nr:hypothetical protein [Candidatus Sungbacteria bacterium]
MDYLPLSPQEATKRICSALPARRMRDVLERRCALKGSEKATLEQIGRIYKITRERVRQIERDAMGRAGAPAHLVQADPIFRAVEAKLASLGRLSGAHHLFSAVAERRHHPHLHFLLTLHPAFVFMPENKEFMDRWTTDKDTAVLAEQVVKHTVAALEAKGQPVSYQELLELAGDAALKIFGKGIDAAHLESYLASSRAIVANPYRQYGLVSWSTITPRGIKDKAYIALRHEGRPAHFREVASLIDRGGWSKKKVHPQTVHNELIKDPRFVLVGRGLYALREWGYERGTVRDIVSSVLKETGRPLTRDEIVSLASQKRMVKPQTILLNLQNRNLFKKTEDGKYTLV